MKITYLGSKEQDGKNLLSKVGDNNNIEYFQIKKGIPTTNLISSDFIIAAVETADDGLSIINSILSANRYDFPYILFMSKNNHKEKLLDILGLIPGDFILLPISSDNFEEYYEIAKRSISIQHQLRQNKGYSKELSTHDLGANVLNRQAIYQRTLGELERAQRGNFELIIALIEISNSQHDEFRNEEISFVAHQLRSNVRLYDLVGRWIGAKFLIVMPGVPVDFNEGIILRLYQSVMKNPLILENEITVPIEIAIGYTWLEKGNKDPLYQLIEQANSGLFAAHEKQQLKIKSFINQ